MCGCCEDLSLELPRTQYEFRDDAGQPLRLDYAYEHQRLVIEADGFEAYRDRFERDRERASRLAAGGWRLIQVTHLALRKRREVVDWVRRGLASVSTPPPWELG
jgi:very-short-patch-repair endonuclease